ncbi:hypothetical protein [Legionella sp. km772]|uniref:hypothetical protein n=1 Tax=Legionella sp. km772 TaxID=2498111 RepID=UPI000F8CE192|nr:hypothetical protein [Legionella sp. km772]RUR08543.1 hypothetical protein ELY15_10595 [Legionella sp. km772]
MQRIDYQLNSAKGLLMAAKDWSMTSNQQPATSTNFPFISTAFKSNSFISSSRYLRLFLLFSVFEQG